LLCIKAANTGTTVLVGIDAPDAVSAVDRLLKWGVSAHGLSDVLNAVLALRLVPKICAHCKSADTPSEGIQTYLEDVGFCLNGDVFRGQGCQLCRHTGYTGNIGIQELFEIDKEAQALIRKYTGIEHLQSWYESSKQQSLLADGLDKAMAGLVVTDDVIYSVAKHQVSTSLPQRSTTNS
jgi:type II secretory ATPase GspE/PulE/Tfp pilus assembly ATPase PilB-like protein